MVLPGVASRRSNCASAQCDTGPNCPSAGGSSNPIAPSRVCNSVARATSPPINGMPMDFFPDAISSSCTRAPCCLRLRAAQYNGARWRRSSGPKGCHTRARARSCCAPRDGNEESASMPKPAFEWKENLACMATYNVLEGDQFLDQFEDTDIPFATAGDTPLG